MSQLQRFLDRLCPEGISFSPISAIAVVTTGTQLNKSAMVDDGSFPVLNGGTGFSGQTTTFNTIGETIAISQGGASAGHVSWISEPFWAGAHCYVLDVNENLIDKRFLFHALLQGQARLQASKRGAGIPGLNRGALNGFLIPTPPMQIQQEIARILDTFSKLEAELEAELEARHKQFTFYRDQLIGSPKHNRVLLGELGIFQRGRRFTKNDVVEKGIPSMHYGEIYTHYGVSATTTISQVRSEMRDQLRFANPNDVVIATVGETVEEVAKAVAWLGDEPVAIHDDAAFFRSDLDPTYVAYAFQTADFHSQKDRFVARGKIKRVSGNGLAQIAISVPTLKEQRRIVAILDNFSSLLRDVQVGLPAEILARRQQYEHYRDCLLTFQEATV